jgi:hypothetical protein
MKTTIRILIVLISIALSTIVRAQILETNVAASQLAATNSDPLLPLIKFEDVPITTTIDNLARQAEINYIIDPHLFQISKFKPEPMITFCLTNISAKDALNRMLNVRNLVLIQDPLTTVARITRKNQPLPFVDASLLQAETNNLVTDAGDIIPTIQFMEEPLDVVLENLIKFGRLNIKLDSHITSPSYISLHWQNITVKQAIIALCQNYDLVVVKDDTTGDIEIKPKLKLKN